jgi:methyl-accepting chemotaxis protein
VQQDSAETSIGQTVKRRIIVVKKSLQLRYGLIAFFVLLIVTGIVGWDVYFTINYRLVNMVEPEILPVLNTINYLLIVKMGIYALIIFLGSYFISFKLAGPLYRFEQSCEEVGNGDLTYRVHLRKNDELLDLQDKFNLMIDSLQSKIQLIEQLSAELESSGNPQKVQELRAELKRQFKIN